MPKVAQLGRGQVRISVEAVLLPQRVLAEVE